MMPWLNNRGIVFGKVILKTIGDAGELDVVERIKKFLPEHSDILVGAGDDCAVVRSAGSETDLVLTSDPVIEGVHFTPDTDPFDVGRKAVGRVLSDLAAMGAVPRWILINLVAPSSTPLAVIDDIYAGANKLLTLFGVVIVGGDVAEGEKLELHVFGTGTVPNRTAVERKGASAGDLVFVTGKLGGSINGKHLSFMPRVEQGIWLRDWATAMMDISDGLASDLRRLVKMSKVGCDLNVKDIPVSESAQKFNDDISPLEHALYDGEDFELLFTIPKGQKEIFLTAWHKEFDLECTCIGTITDHPNIISLVDNGTKKVLSWHGYEHF